MNIDPASFKALVGDLPKIRAISEDVRTQYRISNTVKDNRKTSWCAKGIWTDTWIAFLPVVAPVPRNFAGSILGLLVQASPGFVLKLGDAINPQATELCQPMRNHTRF